MSTSSYDTGNLKEEAEIEVIQVRGEYYRKPILNEKDYPVRRIPRWLLATYADARSQYLDVKAEIKRYFKPMKDTPVTERKVVGEGETHKFNEDGSVTIDSSP